MTEEDIAMAAWCRENHNELRNSERDFLNSLLERQRPLSVKQRKWLKAIYSRLLFGRGGRQL